MENLRAIVPAAGKGTRLRSKDDLPKVMHELCGKPLLEHMLEQLSFIKPEEICIVVGYLKEKVIQYFGDCYRYAEQASQLGTGHAVMVCEPQFRNFDGTVLVTFGDMPLFRGTVMKKMCEHHVSTGAACTLLTAVPARWLRNLSFHGLTHEKSTPRAQKRGLDLNSHRLAFSA